MFRSLRIMPPMSTAPVASLPRYGWCESCGREGFGYLVLPGANVPWCWLETCRSVIHELYGVLYTGCPLHNAAGDIGNDLLHTNVTAPAGQQPRKS